PVFQIPQQARIFAREKWENAPLIAGFKRGAGAVLWIAAPPGPHGYDRFPYIVQALADLGLDPPFRSPRLWAFFDSAYRSRVDLDYFAARWRKAGISALHVAAWHYWERDPQNDEYLRRLIEACHAHAISVYAWIELPHVSQKFWDDHPEWREKTALLQDAQLDWRKLMNLDNPAASAAIGEGLKDLIGRFDWDGVNLAEMYFESLEGFDNPARFTPMSNDVRREFHQLAGFDPVELFNPESPHYGRKDTAGLARFLDFRADLARREQLQWFDRIEQIRNAKPNLDLTLTQVDDRFDPAMREKLGVDSSAALGLLATHNFTLLIEDPATIWNLGPRRYPEIAARYSAPTAARDKLAIDINIVERYQNVYPTKQQTGTELFELVHTAALAFPRVALYFENSIAKPDLPLLAAADSTVDRATRSGNKLAIESREGVEAAWSGPSMLDGKLWPVATDTEMWIPPGAHAIEPALQSPPLRLIDFNGDLKSAASIPNGIEFSYRSAARAMARLDRVPRRIEVDGVEAHPGFAGDVMILPRGQHLVTIVAGPESAP
ncbi:MAG: hypothetical protein ACRD30_05590, partial [Bryobacteraceae bacterium]